MTGRRMNRLINGLLVLVSLTAAFCVCEVVFRRRYAHYFYAPGANVQTIQSYLVSHPELGFIWRPNIAYEGGIVLESEDVEFEPLCTDGDGFVNAPDAIERRNGGAPIDAIGLGDSFIEHGCHAFHERFEEAGLFYYSMAVHRQCPPQYNYILEHYAAACRPRWVVYGLFENDFAETADYDGWRRSGLDWFAYHSGTWCGPAVAPGALRRFLKNHLRGTIAFAEVLRDKFGLPASGASRADTGHSAVYDRIIEAHDFAAARSMQFLLVLIPSKTTVIKSPTTESALFDALVDRLAETEIAVLDLRRLFKHADTPASLYYERDGHWNKRGAGKAAEAVLAHISPCDAKTNKGKARHES